MSSSRKRAAIAKAESKAESLNQQLILARHQYDVMKAIAEKLSQHLDNIREQKPVAWTNAFGEPQKHKDDDFKYPLIEKPFF